MHFSAISPEIFALWWRHQLAALLSPLSRRLVPAGLRRHLHAHAARRRPPLLTLHPATGLPDETHDGARAGSVTLHATLPDDAPRLFSLTPQGLDELANSLRAGRSRRAGRGLTARNRLTKGAMAQDGAARDGAARSTAARSITAQGGLPAHLIVPGLPILSRDLHLPAGLGADASALMRYEIDQITPFAEEDVLWSLRPLAADQRSETRPYRLDLTPRGRIAGPLALLEAHGLRPLSLAATVAPDAPRIVLAPPASPGSRRNRRAALRRSSGRACSSIVWTHASRRWRPRDSWRTGCAPGSRHSRAAPR